MTLFSPTLRPGVNKLDSGLANEGGYSDANCVRNWMGQPQPVGGWSKTFADQFLGLTRASKAWTTLDLEKVLAFGTSEKLYAYIDSTLTDITPNLIETTLVDIFTTVNGSPIVTALVQSHGLKVGDEVTFSNPMASVGGLTIDGPVTVTSVPSADTFKFSYFNATSTVTTPGGGAIDIVVALSAGSEDASAGVSPRIWSLDTWGENLLANPSGFSLFEYQPETSYPDIIFNGTFTGNANGWALGGGWVYATNAVSHTSSVAGNLSQNCQGVLEPGRTYRVNFTLSTTAITFGSLRFRVNAGLTPAVIDVGAASTAILPINQVVTRTFSRLFVCPADPVDILFEADSDFRGTIDNVTITLENKAYRIITAPATIDAFFVDPHGIVVALGANNSEGTYNPALARNSDLGNNRSWIPDTDSLASEYPLRGGGGRLMAGLATRQQNLIWGDGGVFSFQYTGTAGDAFSPNLLGTGCGLSSRHAMAEQNGFVMWVSNTKQFFMFRGLVSGSLGIPEIIPCPLQKDVFDNVDTDQLEKIWAGINSEFSEVWFGYPDARDGDECSRVVAFSWTEGHWHPHLIARTAWEPPGTFQNPIAFAPTRYVYNHESGLLADGDALGEYIETSDFDIEDGDTLHRIMGLVPNFKDQIGTVEFSLFNRIYPNRAAVTAGPFNSTTTQDRVNFRCMARQTRIRWGSAEAGGWWRGVPRIDIVKSGAKQ